MKRLIFYILLIAICNINTFSVKNTESLAPTIYKNHSDALNDFDKYMEGKVQMWIQSPLVCDTILVTADINSSNYTHNYEITIRLYELEDGNILNRKRLIEFDSYDYDRLTTLRYDKIAETKPLNFNISDAYRNYKDLILEYVAFNEYAWLDNYLDFQKVKKWGKRLALKYRRNEYYENCNYPFIIVYRLIPKF